MALGMVQRSYSCSKFLKDLRATLRPQTKNTRERETFYFCARWKTFVLERHAFQHLSVEKYDGIIFSQTNDNPRIKIKEDRFESLYIFSQFNIFRITLIFCRALYTKQSLILTYLTMQQIDFALLF